jgi:protein O-mannosyl-transferase
MTERARRTLVTLVWLGLIAGTLLVYWQVHKFGFVYYDDDTYVFNNRHVLEGLSIPSVTWALTSGYGSNWHPLTWLSLMLDSQLSGGNPGWMHIVNVFLHIANALLLFELFRRLTVALWRSAFVAAVFALHPTHVESVAWIAERKDVLSTLFMLLSIASYAWYVKGASKGRYALALLLFVSGIMTKPMVVTLPFLLLLLDYWPLGRMTGQKGNSQTMSLRKLVVEKIPFFAISAVSCVVTYLVQRSGGSVLDFESLAFSDRMANALVSYARYIGKIFLPVDMAVFYPFVRGGAWWGAVLSLVLLVLVTFAVIRYGRQQKYLPVGWFWFVGTLVPVIGLVQAGGQAMADRYTYIPYIGLSIVIAWTVPRLMPAVRMRTIALSFAVALALAAMGYMAWLQAGYWKDSLTLFTHAVVVTRDNSIAFNNRAAAYYDMGLYEDSIADCQSAIAINPRYAAAYKNLGFAYGKLGRWQDSITQLRHALALRPEYAEVENYIGYAYGMLGQWTQAEESFARATLARKDYDEAWYNLGTAHQRLGYDKEAEQAFLQAIKLNRHYAEAWNSLASVYTAQNRLPEAVDAHTKAIEADPAYAEAYNNLAWLIATRPEIPGRDTRRAIDLAARACELTLQHSPVIMGTLAAAYASAGQYQDAVSTAEKAIELATKAGQPQTAAIVRYHLSFYKQGKPYTETRDGNEANR